MSKTKRSSRSRRSADSRAHEDSPANNPLVHMLQAQRKLLSAGIDSLSTDAMAAGRPHMKSVTGPLQDGFRKLEQVFDDRVAAALQRIGMPSAETLRELIERVDRLSPPARPTRRHNRK
jgi:hypothetical protein